ncbi:MAG TPA: Rieske (2Fe-2S) protein [Planctomycetota bacterium]|nr:Rieske (2Fe-2S) protein [Planctomycetota bacterium]
MTRLGWRRALSASEIGEGEGRSLVLAGVPIVVYRAGGRFHALGARCPHAGGRLSETAVDGAVAVCPSHGWSFRLVDGRCTGFRTAHVPVFRTRLEAGDVWVRIGWLRPLLFRGVAAHDSPPR